MFHRKLDLLMRLTGTSNSALGAAISMAPSYISKLRSGSRTLPRDPAFLRPMCDYLARKLVTEEQMRTMQSLLELDGPLPDDQKERTELLLAWVSEQALKRASLPPETACRVTEQAQVYQEPDLHVMAEATNSPLPRSLKLYFGISGRREAVLRLLSEVAAQKKSQTLLLYSDDSLEWLTGDPEYAKLWSDRMLQLFHAGHRLRTIHSSHRSADDMYKTLRAWLPLYVSGSLEIYFCPKVRDNLFFHSMFIAPEVAAFTSFSVSRDETETLNTYYTNGNALKILEHDFYNFLKQCRPLLYACTPSNSAYFWDNVKAFSGVAASSASLSYALPGVTVPLATMESVQQRTGVQFPEIYSHFEVGLLKQLQSFEYYDIYSLPSIENARSGRVGFPMAQMIGADQIYYTVEELCSQIRFLIFLTETFSTYHPYILRKTDQQYSVFVKEGYGVLISNTKRVQGSELHMIRKGSIAYDYWNYLEARRSSPGVISDRRVILRTLREYLTALDPDDRLAEVPVLAD